MILSKQQRSHLPRMNMTPMIDVVFLLIIFFMTVSQVSDLSKERLELARLEGSVDQQPAEVIVNVAEDGRLIVDGEIVTLPRLIEILQVGVEFHGGPERVAIVLRIDRRGDSRAANEVVEALQRLGIRRSNVAVTVPQL